MFEELQNLSTKDFIRTIFDMHSLYKRNKLWPSEYINFGIHYKDHVNDKNNYVGLEQSRHIWGFNNTKVRDRLNDKYLTEKRLRDYGIPTTNTTMYDIELPTVALVEEINKHDYIGKPRFGTGAKDFIPSTKGAFESTSAKINLIDTLCRYRYDYLFQDRLYPIQQTIDAFNTPAVCTIRVTTHHQNIMAMTLRIPGEYGGADNYSIPGNRMGNIDKLGRLTSLFRYERGKNVKQDLIDFKLDGEYFYRIAKVMKNGLQMENAHILGWDVALTDNGPVVIEINARPGLDIVQIARNKGLKTLL